MSERTTVFASLEADEQYGDLEIAVFNILPSGPLFETDADPEAMWHAYLDNLPEERRQHYTCDSCRYFIQRFGGLVTIDDTGRQHSALWEFMPPDFFLRSVEHLHSLVKKAKVAGVFLSSDKTLGTPRTGDWTHIAAVNPKPFLTSRGLSAWQAMAEKTEDYKMLCHGLADYSRDAVEQAVRVLKSDAMYRGEKTLGVAEWFLKLHEAIRDNPHAKRNLTWLAVANAPPGFCHIRSTMISTLLDDINSGLPFDHISRRWKDKMHPLQYQRPTAAPKEGAIKQAEELVAKLGLERSFLRRYATLDDVLAKLWVPQDLPDAPNGNGVFGHLRNQRKPEAIELPATKMTWEKFARTILPDVLKMEAHAPSHGNYCGIVTATDPEAPAIIQWDGLEGHPRNPVSWYVYNGGSSAHNWGLTPGWVNVSAVFRGPHKWQEPDKFKHQADSICFALEGCRDSRTAELCLFPEILKTELHGIRAVIEAHSRRGGTITGGENANANGLIFNSGSPVTLRVRTPFGLASHIIDRMD